MASTFGVNTGELKDQATRFHNFASTFKETASALREVVDGLPADFGGDPVGRQMSSQIEPPLSEMHEAVTAVARVLIKVNSGIQDMAQGFEDAESSAASHARRMH
ncbi:hypothetical protein [Streptomyces sp. NPDC093970]|uniref:WXG100 family type VII secretion target n=1 Tax=Streptomyces sp. NPDC093970 TaxID=3155076 RepID=UPI00343F7EA8